MIHPTPMRALVAVWLLSFSGSISAAEIEDMALAAIREMTEFLVAADNFTFRLDTSYDVVQDSGIKVEFGGSRVAAISRPDRFSFDVQRRDGLESLLVFDGKQLWAYVPDEQAYAMTEFEGSIDDAIHFAVSELRIKAPLADLFSPDLYDIITDKLTRALHLGRVMLEDTVCNHLLLSNDYADYQLWIEDGELPVLRRIVITYREERGEPQFRARFVDWNLTPDPAGLFDFTPPEGADRVLFYIPGPEDALPEEDRS
jgi:hypothetical protein